MNFVTVTNHVYESLESLGVCSTRIEMSAILAVLAEKNIEYSVQAIQERNKWFVPIIYPAHGQDIDPISMWLVLAEPRDRCPQSHYVMLTALHPNHPMIRKVWTWTGPEDPVQGRIQMFEGINDK